MAATQRNPAVTIKSALRFEGMRASPGCGWPPHWVEIAAAARPARRPDWRYRDVNLLALRHQGIARQRIGVFSAYQRCADAAKRVCFGRLEST